LDQIARREINKFTENSLNANDMYQTRTLSSNSNRWKEAGPRNAESTSRGAQSQAKNGATNLDPSTGDVVDSISGWPSL